MEIQHKISLIILFITVLNLSYSITKAQSEIPCSNPDASQFDFWVGEWNGQWKDSDGKIQTCSNSVTKILNSCVIEENFSTSDNTFTGKSVSVYNPAKKVWLQTWVDNSGAYMDFSGGFNENKMILHRKGKNKEGIEILQRMIFYDITQSSFYWNWEVSTDGGNTWKLIWKIYYTRKS